VDRDFARGLFTAHQPRKGSFSRASFNVNFRVSVFSQGHFSGVPAMTPVVADVQPPTNVVSAPMTNRSHSRNNRRRSIWLVAAILAVTFASAGLMLSQVPRANTGAGVYALLSVAPSSDLLDPERTKHASANLDVLVQNHIALLKSRLVFNSALRNINTKEVDFLKTQKDPVAWLDNNLRAERVGNSAVIRASMSGADRQGLITVLDAVINAFANQAEDRTKMAQLQELKQLGDILRQWERRYTARLSAYLQQERNLDLSGSRLQWAREDLNAYEAEARRITFTRNAAQARLQVSSSTNKAEANVAKLRDEVAQSNCELKAIKPDIDRLKQEAEHSAISIELLMMKEQLDAQNQMIERLRRLQEELSVRLEFGNAGIAVLQGAQ
jgi:hypothetical protein